jgi:hypothetical protein
MGEAKRRKAIANPTVYHHTSTLRTNLIWMSGEIDVEGNQKKVLHPQLGVIGTDASLRRPMADFPAVAWFTRNLNIPKVLIVSKLYFEDKNTGAIKPMEVGTEIAHGMSLNRVALGFPLAEINVTPWPQYRGYATPEGRELNETARAAGDNPNDWYVSETPIDVMKVSEFWSSQSILNPKLKRSDSYISDIRRMVTMCRENEGVFIPPTWLTTAQATEISRRLGLPIANVA